MFWKIQHKRQIKYTDNTQIKYNTDKVNNTKLPRFSRFLWHSPWKWGGLILQRSGAHTGHVT